MWLGAGVCLCSECPNLGLDLEFQVLDASVVGIDCCFEA